MPARWYLFAVINYLLLLIYGFLLILAMQFSIEKMQPGESLSDFTVYFVGLFIIVINSIRNIYIYHRYLPCKQFSPRLKTIQKIFTIVFAIGWLMMIISLLIAFIDINSDKETDSEKDLAIGLLCLIIFTFASGLFVLVSQFKASKLIEESSNANNEENPS